LGLVHVSQHAVSYQTYIGIKISSLQMWLGDTHLAENGTNGYAGVG
jgi:hypothetical protein